jgi:hypothetical protein
MGSKEAENTLPQETSIKPDRPPRVLMTFSTNFIPLQSDLKIPSQRRVRVPKYTKCNLYYKKLNGIFNHGIVPGEK